MEYNTQREHLIIPEYGRNIQKMIQHAVSIKDKEERNKCARTIVDVMGELNPHLRDVADFKHKLWDHLFIISDFKLEVDSPFDLPTPESVDVAPERIDYPAKAYKHRHYGKTIVGMITKAVEFKDGPEKEALIIIIANHLKKSYLTWNRDTVEDQKIFDDLADLSDGKLKVPEGFEFADMGHITPQGQQRTNQNQRGKKRNPRSGGSWSRSNNRRRQHSR
ncbi:MAG: DUF4290 domain-containing protein [Flavobacteriales bacterium]|nr:DUF4290 domain-containing protein [Flavobacteriales bacterium]